MSRGKGYALRNWIRLNVGWVKITRPSEVKGCRLSPEELTAVIHINIAPFFSMSINLGKMLIIANAIVSTILYCR